MPSADFHQHVAAFAAGTIYPSEALPSSRPETLRSVVQKRKLIHPSHQAALRPRERHQPRGTRASVF